jgi:Subtilisin-like serine proteases
MHKKSTYRVLALFLAVGMLFSMLNIATTPVTAQSGTEPNLEKVEAEVLDAISTKGEADFVIEMAEKADLSAAYAIKDWSERGWFVYNTLKETAARTQAPVIAVLKASGLKYESFYAGNEIAVTGSGMAVLSQIAALDAVGHIRYPRTATIDPIDPLTQNLFDFSIDALDWGITDTNADDFWSAFGLQGDGIVVANIDTGVQWDHPALDQAFKCGTNPSDPSCWADPANICGGSVCDNNGHGTHTMGTMVGDDDPTLTYQVGMAPNAQWIACKGCETNSCSDASLNACADWILAPGGSPDNRPNIVNNSWGGGGGDNWYLAKVQAWRAAGIFPAFSAGNSGSSCGTLGSPGDYQESFATASHQSSRTISSFSSRGPSAFGDDPYTKPNISAPGDPICSSVPGSGWDCSYSGTSMASPHVAGAVALLWSCNASLVGDMATTFELLQDTADPANDAGNCGAPADGEDNYTYGYGYLNVLAAGQQVCSAGTLTGMVTDSSAAPLEGATVTADNGAGLVVDADTAADGTYTLTLPDGTYTVTAQKYGYDMDSASGVVVTEGETTTQDFVLAPLGTSLVSGVVYDVGVGVLPYHGYPLYAAIHITAGGFDETIFSDPITGEYAIELVSETEHTITTTALAPGYEELVEAVTPSGAAYTHDIPLLVEAEACAAPGYQPDYDFFWSFEQTDGGFTPGGTTSFAWGDFTSGPMAGHSGTKGIATNPGGVYNASELGWMASPVIDLSGNGTNSTAIQWWDWKDIDSALYDWARLDVTKDGGVTWITVWGPVGDVLDTDYSQQTVVLDATYNVSNFQFRFYFKSDSSVQYEGWYVDDVGIFGFTAPPETIVYEEDFNSTNGSFVATGTPTVEWEWGVPTTTFPGACTDGNCWDTVLAGNYTASTNQTLASPAIDLSGVVLPPGQTLYLKWWQAAHVESNTFDDAWAEISTDGITWTTIWANPSSTITETWNQKSYDISSYAGEGSVYLRFRLTSDSSVQYEGYSVDHIKISYQEPIVIPAAECTIIHGGVVAGFVYDDNDGSPLVGADVYSAEVATQTISIPEDPDNEGLYWAFQPFTAPHTVASISPMGLSEPHDFTAEKDLYGSQTETVNVLEDAITQQNFTLGTGELSVDPLSLHVNMIMGDPAETEPLTIINEGTSDAMFEIVEKDDGFVPPLSIPAFTDAQPEDSRTISMGKAPEAAKGVGLEKSASGLDGILAGAPAFAIDIYPGYNLVNIPDTDIPGVWNIVGSVGTYDFFAGDFVGGDFTTLYAVEYNTNGLYAINTATAAQTLIGPTTPPAGQTFSGLTGTPDGTMYGMVTDCASSNLVTVDIATGATTLLGALPGVGCGIDLAYNTDDDMIYIVDLLTDHLFKVDPATLAVTDVGALGVAANYAQGMDFEEESGVLYWAAYTTAGELRVIDTTTGASTLVGAFPGGAEVDSLAFPTGGQSDVPWLSEDPVSGTVAGGSSLDITVTFDPTGAGLTQPGDYQAELKIEHDTPYTVPNVPVTLHLVAPDTFGTVNGTVSGLEACDVNPAPLEGATVNFWQGGSLVYTTSTLASGYYTYTVPAGTYDIEVVAAGYVTAIAEDVEVLGGSTLIQDFDLRLIAPCLSVLPTELEQTQAPDTTTTQTLTVVNSGATVGSFELIELPVAGIFADQLLQDPSFELYTPNLYWDEYSENFGTPLCTVEDCGTGTGTGPRTGLVWSWFGGSETGDEGYVSQDVLILPGTASMTFYVEQYVCGTGGASNYMALKIDGTELWRTDGLDPACGVLGYRLIEVDVSGFADGDTHEIMFDSVTIGDGNFFIDDVELNLEAGGDVPWLSEDPVAGTVPADGSLAISITYDSTALAEGDYFATLSVKNAPAPAIDVPVTLHVTSTQYFYIPLLFK